MIINKCATKQQWKDQLPHKTIKNQKGYDNCINKHEFLNQKGDIRCPKGSVYPVSCTSPIVLLVKFSTSNLKRRMLDACKYAPMSLYRTCINKYGTYAVVFLGSVN